MPTTKRLLRSVRRLPFIVVGVTIAAIVLFLLASWHNYQQIRDEQITDAQHDADRVLLAVDDHVARLLDYADSYLRSLRAYYVEHGNGEAFRTHVTDTRTTDEQSFIGDIAIVDAAGIPTFLLSNPNPPKTPISDLPYFKTLENDPGDRLIVDPTHEGRATHQYLFRIARSIRINGHFEGIIVIALRPEAIIDLFQEFGLGPHSTISVVQTDDHQFVARQPIGDRSVLGKRFDTFELWDHLKDGPRGLYHRESPIDHLARYYAFQKTSAYPLASVVSIADIDIDANLAGARRDIELEGLLFTAAAIAICALVLRIIRVEARLLRSNSNLVHAQRMGKIGSVEVDLVAMKAHWSEELYRIYDRNPAMGPANLDEFLAYVHPDDRATVAEMREQHLHGDVKGANEYRVVLRDGSTRWIHREVEVIRDPNGRPIKLIAAEQDITQQKLLDQAKDAFVSTVSHELRTPLTSIRGALGLIASGAAGALPEKTQKLFEIAHRNSDRLSRLVNDLLDLQRIGAGRMVYHIADVVLAKIITDAIETIRPFAKERDIEISFASTCPDAMVRADVERITQVMDNLLSNAIKFSKPGQTIAVTLIRRHPVLRITVEDHGEGIPEAFRPRIFQRFSQADSSDTRKIGGSGLGLNIVHSIVGHHDGQVSFESTVGQGTRFHVDLPELEDPAMAAKVARVST